MNIGFSTGSLALGDFVKAIQMLDDENSNVIELSALRERELETLISSLDDLNLNQFKYISFHAPSKLNFYSEKELVHILLKVVERGWPIILHPDVIQDIELWKQLGPFLCIENMDKRKPVGRTTYDLEKIFERLPEASFCFDLAHVRQVDPTMTEAFEMIKKFSKRLKQLHVSDVNSMSVHEPLNLEALLAFRKIAECINPDTPIILESPVKKKDIQFEIKFASLLFDNIEFEKLISRFKLSINTHTNSVYRKELYSEEY